MVFRGLRKVMSGASSSSSSTLSSAEYNSDAASTTSSDSSCSSTSNSPHQPAANSSSLRPVVITTITACAAPSAPKSKPKASKLNRFSLLGRSANSTRTPSPPASSLASKQKQEVWVHPPLRYTKKPCPRHTAMLAAWQFTFRDEDSVVDGLGDGVARNASFGSSCSPLSSRNNSLVV